MYVYIGRSRYIKYKLLITKSIITILSKRYKKYGYCILMRISNPDPYCPFYNCLCVLHFYMNGIF